MQLIRQVDQEKAKVHQFHRYQYSQGCWRLSGYFSIRKQEELYTYLATLNIPVDYAILHLDGCFRNTFYACFPNITIMMTPRVIWQYCSQLWPTMSEAIYTEVAIGLEEGSFETSCHEPIGLFLYGFYRKRTKEEALAYYERWQLDQIKVDPSTRHFIRTMEYFKEEILNYFILRELMD